MARSKHTDIQADTGSSYLTGQFLIAMPNMSDPRFERSLIYMISHTQEGAMGLILNKKSEFINLPDLLKQLDMEEVLSDRQEAIARIPIYFGGPVEVGRGFVLHGNDYFVPEVTWRVSEKVSMTATLDILKTVAMQEGPQPNRIIFGYAGWGSGQLEAEIQANGWLNCEADPDLIFDDDIDTKWQRAIAKLGIDVSMLSSSAGHA